MAGGVAWSRRVGARTRTLRTLLRDTQRALHDVADVLSFEPEISIAVQEIGNQSLRSTALVVLGTSAAARARLLHAILGRPLLPDPPPRGGRWVRIQYGSSTQVHLSLGNSEFELVEELECNRRAWDTLPLEDLIRQDQTDLTTILEVELNNQFLKDGLKIIIPPDLATDPGLIDHLTLKRHHSELYNKRNSILKHVNPIYLYAIDRMGKNIFSDTICGSISTSRSEEDFWNTFSLYYNSKANEGPNERDTTETVRERVQNNSRMPAVFSGENCLDLHQVKELNPNAQLLFFLFADSEDMDSNPQPCHRSEEATESTEEPYRSEELPESDQGLLKDGVHSRHTEEFSEHTTACANRRLYEEQNAFMNDLLDQWEMMTSPPPKHQVRSQWAIVEDGGRGHKSREDDRTLRSRTALLNTVVKFAADCVHASLLQLCTRLSEVHVRLVQQLVLASFDLARELQLVPRKIQYVATQEQHLYDTINEKFSEGDKKQELVAIMQEVLHEMRHEVTNMDWSVDDLPCHQDRRFVISNSTFYNSSRSSPEGVPIRLSDCARTSDIGRTSDTTRAVRSDAEASDGEEAVSYDSYNFDDYEIIRSNEESFGASECFNGRIKSDEDSHPYTSIRVENESGMVSLSSTAWTNTSSPIATSTTSVATCTNTLTLSFKQASLDVQQTVLSKLSRKISVKLVKFMDCLKDTYFGTLHRCLESLEEACRQELGGRPASEAARRLLGAARHVDLQPCASFSLLRSLLDSLRRLLHRLRLVGGEAEQACCVLSPVWRRRVALQTVHSLSPQRLARVISTQILERLSLAHEKYQSALSSLETALAGKLHHTEDVKLAIRKKYAPSFARLCLESTSMCDLLMYGTPELGREIGRGQYGVVYAARGGWGGRSPVAVKSVLPADDRHYHELAMEFFYTRSIPAHPRVVRPYGSVVQRSAHGPAVLLVSARRARDLHAAVRQGLAWHNRMRVALDIVQGIRYLHSLGLVHRDIKMKNVLLDANDRAALSDLGFCAAEALMSGSVVGTPVHMAPELLAGDYDANVDVYAFGILFWYVCAGNVKLPSAFEAFQNKEQLWSKVKRGLRPERLPHFSDECWEVMEACWASEPSQRAHLGDIQPKLERILQLALDDEAKSEPCPARNKDSDNSEDESLDMTGIDKDL